MFGRYVAVSLFVGVVDYTRISCQKLWQSRRLVLLLGARILAMVANHIQPPEVPSTH